MNGGSLFLLVAMFALLYVLLIRPQRRKLMVQQRMQHSVEIGDEVLTAAGIYGVVRSIGAHDELHVEIAPGTTVRVARRAIGAVIPPDEPEVEPEDESDEVGEVDDGASAGEHRS